MDTHTKRKYVRKDIGKQDISGQAVESAFIGQLDNLRDISQMNARTAENIRQVVERAEQTKIAVDTAEFERLTRSAIYEMQTQIRYLKQPPIVLKVIIAMFVTALLSVMLCGYLFQKNREIKYQRDYWYEKSETLKN